MARHLRAIFTVRTMGDTERIVRILRATLRAFRERDAHATLRIERDKPPPLAHDQDGD